MTVEMTEDMASDIFREAVSDNQSKYDNKVAAIADEDVDTVCYWIYSPGEGSSMWEEFYSSEIMAIGWGGIGDLKAYDTKDAMKARMREMYDAGLSYKNAAHATWQFANEMKIGDVVFVKKVCISWLAVELSPLSMNMILREMMSMEIPAG